MVSAEGYTQEYTSELIELLLKTTDTRKHQAYQTLANRIHHALGKTGISLVPRHEAARLEYVLTKLELKDKNILDIGCNTGYFMFESLEAGAKSVTGYEGGMYHYQFVKRAAQLLYADADVRVIPEYFDFDAKDKYVEQYDVTFLLNILHHLGDDYGDSSTAAEAVKPRMIEQLNSMHDKTEYLVFQLGFNWKADITKGIFDTGTKAEMIDYIKAGTREYWDIEAIGIPEGSKAHARYHDLNDTNIARDDEMGEFLNRPLFILKSK